MDYQFPKRILEEGAETKIDKINNTCRCTILGTLKVVLRDEYQEVLKDPVFGPILAIVENKLIYSGKIIHSFICKNLKVSKLHELWFLFAKRPLRFSMQEFYDVTGLKFKEEPDVDFNNWKSDKGFWSTVLKENRKINLLIIRDELLKVCNEWTYVDRVRLVYLCIIHGFFIAKDLRVFIPHEFIRLVMDFEKMRMYPWGLGAYDELIASIFKAREDVHLKNSYVLDGFSYAFQIWIMEAIPDIGSMVGKKIKKNLAKVRCRSWKGSGKPNFDKRELFPFISSTGSSEEIDNVEFFREDEKNDGRVGRIVALIKDVEVENVTETHVEEPAVVAEEPVVVTKRGKRKLIDPGVESRKKQLLCQWTGEHNSGVSGEMKTFIKILFTSTFNSFKELLQKDIQECFDKVDNEMAQLKETMSQITGPSNAMGRDRASEILSKGKGKGKAAVSVDPPPLRLQTDDDDMFDFLKNLSQSSNYVDKGMQESLQDAMGNLSQASHVKGFNPSQKLKDEEPAEWVTPLSSVQPPDWRPPTLKDEELLEDRVHDSDHSLVFVPEDSWAKLNEWSSTSNELKIGPSMLTSELAAHVMGPTEWLKNYKIDAIMYLFTERTTLRRWEPTKVAFMNCTFSNQMKNSFEEFRKDKKKFKVSELLHRYDIGELPAHGRT
ncbi:hypothetical protein Bca52824_087853 [Brassica carinata]|uniref:DUF1985 domain-containing protein n=1 Tax=Brassica carinata TaxID=52824 RepID=A0A8X7PBK4_BRACI|nr:hypothetical protein Bca52824_087853 [Brassica carinata]